MNERKVIDWIVKILPSETAERAEGTGFWAAPAGYVLTCWHVVEQMENPWVEYKGNRKLAEKAAHVGDIALLRVKELNGPPAILDLHSNWEVGNKIYSLGYQYEGRQGEIELGCFPIGKGELKGDSEIDRYGAIVLEGAKHVEPGASGAPALNCDTGKVIGLIGAKWPHQECQFVLPLSLVDADTEPWRLLRPTFQPVDYEYGQEAIFRYYDIFVGRENEINVVKDFIAAPEGGYLMFEGAAGMGKSALIAELARRAARSELHPHLSCLSVFIRQEGGKHTPEIFLKSLNRQLLQMLAETVEVPPTLAEKEIQYECLWSKVTTGLDSQNRLLVLVDGWDEGVWGELQPLASYLPEAVPPYAYWVLTSRLLPEVKNTFPTTHALQKIDPHRLPGLGPQEVRQLLQCAQDKVSRSDAFIAELITRTRGEPLFLRFLCQDIAAWGAEAHKHLRETPAAVSEYFRRQFNLLRERARETCHRTPFDILKILLVAFSGMTVHELAGVLERPLFEVQESIKMVERFLMGHECYELMHLEFRHTLDREMVRQVEKRDTLERLVNYCARHWPENLPAETYPLRFYLRHLCELERYPDILQACEAGFMEAKLRHLESTELIEDDYTYVYKACERLNDLKAFLGWAEKRAIIADEVNAFLHTDSKLVKWENALGLCALKPTVEGKIKAYLYVCQGLNPARDGALHWEVVKRIQSLLQVLNKSALRDTLTLSYIETIARWREPYLARAEQALEQIGNAKARCWALLAVAQGHAQLADLGKAVLLLQRALQVTEQISGMWNRTPALGSAGPGLCSIAGQEGSRQGP